MLPIFNKHWWEEVLFEMRWYLFLEKEPKKYIGHNPLAQLSMFFFVVLGSIFMIFTGFAMYSEGTGLGSWQDRLFGWVIPLFWTKPRCSHRASFRHVGDGDFYDGAYLCGDS